MHIDRPQSVSPGRVRTGIRLHGMIVLLLMVTAFVDVPSTVSFGRVSGMGLLTLVQVAIAIVAVAACRTYPRRLVSVLLPYGGFLLWAGIGVLWAPSTIAGLP